MSNQFFEGEHTQEQQPQPQPQPQAQHEFVNPIIPNVPPFDQAPMGQSTQSSAPSFVDVLRKSSMTSMLSPDGIKYIKDLKELLSNQDNVADGAVIRITSLSYPSEALAVHCGKYAVVIIFSEAVSNTDTNIPTVGYARGAVRTMRELIGQDVQLLNTIVITPRDYNRVTHMASHLINVFKTMIIPEFQALNASSFNNLSIDVSPNPEIYDSMVERSSVHSTPARADIRLTFFLSDGKKNTNDSGVFSRAEHSVNRTDIAAVGAYVVFNIITTPEGYHKYIPEIHISEITCRVIYDGMLPVILSLATEILIDNGVWRSQFSDIGKNIPNVGNLVFDPSTNAPWYVENTAQRDAFFQQYCTDPILVIDIVEGRARIPGLELYGFNTDPSVPMEHPLVAKYNRFLGGQVLAPQQPITKVICHEYGGYFVSGPGYQDSRWCDYLTLMIHNSSSMDRLRELLRHQSKEEARVEIIRPFATALELHFVNHIAMVMPEAIRPVQMIIKDKIRVINGTNSSGTVDMTSLLNMGRFTAANGGYYQSPNPFVQIYQQPYMGANWRY